MVHLIEHGPTVRVVGVSRPNVSELYFYLMERDFAFPTPDHDGHIDDPALLVEIGGRISYESWHRGDRPRAEYINESIGAHGHFSTYEHVWYNLLCQDFPRSVLAELTRHRVGVAYSFNSQRYTDKRLRFIVPPLVRWSPVQIERLRDVCAFAERHYIDLKVAMESYARGDKTLRKKRTAEAARAVLPNCTALDGLVTINARALRHIVALRTDEHADLSFRELAYAMFKAAQGVTPALFQDAVETESELVPVVTFSHGGH